MRFLLTTDLPRCEPTYGASAVTYYLAQACESAGHDVTVVANPNSLVGADRQAYWENVLKTHAAERDVIELPHDALRKPRTHYPHGPLLVGRCVLWDGHAETAGAPSRFRRGLAKQLQTLRPRRRNSKTSPAAPSAQELTATWDLLNVANSWDRRALVEAGAQSEKVVVFPYALPQDTQEKLQQNVDKSVQDIPRIAFLGTFDFRKGCVDLIELLEAIAAQLPEVKLRLIGAKGMYQQAFRIRSAFPLRHQHRLEIIMRFERSSLPALLADCRVGVFPSYWEGFGLGVLEMLTAGLPVVAYDAPGPCDILPADWRVPRGDLTALGQTIMPWLTNTAAWEAAHQRCSLYTDFDWATIARQTVATYQAHG